MNLFGHPNKSLTFVLCLRKDMLMKKSIRNQLLGLTVLFTSFASVLSCGRAEDENAPPYSASAIDAAPSQSPAAHPGASGNPNALNCSATEQNPMKAALHAWACEKIAREKNAKKPMGEPVEE